jgi:hypothetical protein
MDLRIDSPQIFEGLSLLKREQVQIKGRRNSLAKAECCGRSRSKSITVGAHRTTFRKTPRQ